MLGRVNGNGCGDHPTGVIGTGYRLYRARARICVDARVDAREAARKMIMLRSRISRARKKEGKKESGTSLSYD